jgi:sugar phosphate isomerase/epimerase
MTTINRRSFIKASTAAAVALASGAAAALAADAPARKYKFTMCLQPGVIGVPSDASRIIGWAVEYGFDAIEPQTGFLQKASDAELADYLGQMKQHGLSWGGAGLPVDFKGADTGFEGSMRTLPAYCKSLQRAGVTRVVTWLTPSHRTLTYIANFRLHARRLREVAGVLGDHGIRLGLEYVGPKTSRVNARYEFIHTMAEMKDLIAEIGRDNVGFLLDSWHWYTAQETEADLLSLKGSDVVMCHLNDAPLDVPVDQQRDGRRMLPCTTGVIDMKAFMNAMVKIGFDGPMVAEPLGAEELRGRSAAENLAAVSAAMKRAFALIE